ncbi:polysaccharide biosynthesis protein [Glycomyces buryatensis]|uniref:NAD-dependent epimerase/dehydratase family protein n=1 Tax=Glycomyces buryatensis TaxID=2570927 RepID=A0A4S8Q0I7_9ACTN|nr:polysaccharide biosynthesis protein [Glycomyces buryatensis]THV33584.1 NAD-dependent epimerase/dehydratase family protein [Glycomyces buryatensis]
MKEDLAGKTVLITGGTGTFGKTMVARLLASDCAEIRVLSRDEAKQDDMRLRLRDERLRFYISDVRDHDGVLRACTGADHVFHAAALKQVPSGEFFPLEAVRTNVMGSANVIDAARAANVRSVVCLSTDKAVYPINAMGMSKALMEKVAQAYARMVCTGDTVVSLVRYGNVLCSRGSVVPAFVRLIKQGSPLTITNPNMTRFLMSINDAIRLVEHAFNASRPGDLYVHKAPASTVEDIARAVARIFDVELKADIIGTRHGEKLFETLVGDEESARAEDQGEFFRIPLDQRGLNYLPTGGSGRGAPEATAVGYTSHNARRLDEDAVVKLLLQTPEFRSEMPTQRVPETV